LGEILRAGNGDYHQTLSLIKIRCRLWVEGGHSPWYPRNSMTAQSLTTERLLLRRWREQDVEPFAAICADPEVMRYIGSGAVRSYEQTQASVAAFEQEWDQKGYGLFAVELRESGQLIGFTGLSEPTFLPEILPAVEIGWRLARSSWGNGYATEAARAALRFGLTTLRLPELVSIYVVGNEASARVIRKLGMRFDRDTIHPGCDRRIRVFRTS
jgi:RimJ/RimL family protein N-acetyltransferase